MERSVFFEQDWIDVQEGPVDFVRIKRQGGQIQSTLPDAKEPQREIPEVPLEEIETAVSQLPIPTLVATRACLGAKFDLAHSKQVLDGSYFKNPVFQLSEEERYKDAKLDYDPQDCRSAHRFENRFCGRH